MLLICKGAQSKRSIEVWFFDFENAMDGGVLLLHGRQPGKGQAAAQGNAVVLNAPQRALPARTRFSR
jgi:hypothetical protein